MGRTFVDRNFLNRSHSAEKLTFQKNIDSIHIENRFYISEICTKTGQIISFKDKRTKNFKKEIVKENEYLN
jgi:Fe2+ or Zn2+ uptake regulation protein